MLNDDSKTMSMRATLLLWVLIPLIVLTALSTVVAGHFAQGFANDFFDSFLLNSADSIAGRVHVGHEGIYLANLPAESQTLFGHNGIDRFFYRVLDSKGRQIAGNMTYELPEPAKGRWQRFGTTVVDQTAVRFCTVPIATESGEMMVQVGETVNNRHILLSKVFLSILMPQIVLVCLACVSVWLGVSKGLKPLHQLRMVLRSRDKPDFSPISIGHVPSELVPVLGALNDLFCRLGNQFRLQHEFIANAAHQLRTPVTAVKTYTEHLTRMEMSAPARAALTGLEEASERLVTMVNRLLLLARMEAKRTYEGSVADLTLVVGEAASAVINLAQERQIELIFDLPLTSVNVQADASDAIELVSNLLDNAIKYTPERGTVWVSLRQNNEATVCLLVEDSGPGIPEEHKENIFQRFFRLPGETGPGCGLGMAIVKEIASGSNATIAVSDRIGGGSSFKVSFRRTGLAN